MAAIMTGNEKMITVECRAELHGFGPGSGHLFKVADGFHTMELCPEHFGQLFDRLAPVVFGN